MTVIYSVAMIKLLSVKVPQSGRILCARHFILFICEKPTVEGEVQITEVFS